MSTALITGASSGIGLAFARAFARRGWSLVLVARSEQRLREAAAGLHALGAAAVEVLPADLGDRGQVEHVRARLVDPARPVRVLVNNAGFGIDGTFSEPNVAAQDHAFEVMVRAVAVLSGAAAEAMTARGRGAILTVSSVAGFVHLGPYSAVKAWATAFAQSLAVELRGTGVRSAALCPGWVRTEFHERAAMDTSSIPSFLWLDADAVVEEFLRDVARGVVVSVPSWRFAIPMALVRHLPGPLVRGLSAAVSARR
ncbi:KR domain-containing protein [Rathayibacter tritici]|uniref:Short-chain dehydrogenase n=1 Tax=Rathayibacter tritici TaxID=33888 RepID=A0A160KUC8_9MICO|nr:SDR family NAD(P)-dependent oxidoreductase [Rathayibacter tritici]AND17486.1 short-chain dehydrogenase [Rathayibacter tritici]PPF68178.1 KR domain-containing protein [Rathayibacter tritici]PPG07938.1 KR domain-containing protein [Rathayibacter tritici]PPI50236.1 KR domain-containing protein [Rathayibacter tritici]